jgi:D-3-phosphoglycerate dehydrogenase
MQNNVVMVSAPYMLPFMDRFAPVFEHYGCKLILPDVYERMSEQDILKYAGKFDGTVCGDDRYTRDVIEHCVPRLKVISKWGTGIDSIDKTAAEENGVKVTRTENAFTVPVSDSVLAYILAFARKQPWMDKAMKRGEWSKIPGLSLSEQTLGVIGVGYIGKEVLRKAHVFGMRLLANDIKEIQPDFIDQYGIEVVSLDELLQKSDVISVNCDLNPTSRHLLNEEAFARMRTNVVVVNTARGPIIDEKALITSLRENRIAGAGLDVFEDEPLPSNSPLLGMHQVLLAPHNSNSSPKAWENVQWNTIKNLLEGLSINHKDFDQLKEKYFKA